MSAHTDVRPEVPKGTSSQIHWVIMLGTHVYLRQLQLLIILSYLKPEGEKIYC